MAQRRLWRVLQFGAGALLVGLAIRSIVLNWQTLRSQPIEWQLSPAWIAASVLVVFSAYGVLIEAWRRVVISMGERLAFGSAARIWLLASLGKYVPGKVWAVAGAAVLAQRAGVDPSVAVAGALVLQALALASGAAVVALTAREAFQAVGPGVVPLAGALIALSLAGIAALASQPLLDRVNRLLPSSLPPLRAISPGILAAAFIANVLAWSAYGVALLLLSKGLLPGVSLSLAQAIGVFTCSYLVGFIALFAPGGLGPRESVFLLMLAGDIGLKPAAGLALASRLLLTGTEVLPAVPLLLRRRAANRPSVHEARVDPTPNSDLDRLPRWAPFVVMGALTLVVFYRYLLSGPGEMLMGQDTIAAGIMFRKFFVEHIRALGRLPLWNPYLFGGVPTIEAGSGDILYPASVLHFLLPLTSALAWKLILHVYLAGVFMYLAARALGARRYVALFAGSAYLLSANLVSLVWGGQDGKMYVIALFPAALWLLVTALERRSWLRFLWLGVVAGLMVVAHPQLAYYAYLAVAAYALGSLWTRRREGGAALAGILAGGMIAVVTAAGVAAVVLLPMYRYLREDSPRAGPGRGFEYSASWSLHAEEALSLFIPEFSGTDVQSETYWGKNPFKHNSEYGGALVLVLGIAALFGLKGDRRRWGLGAMAAVALLYALGSGTPVFRLLYSVVPGLKNFRAPSLAAFVAIAALTLLAGSLMNRALVDKDPSARRAMSAALLAGGIVALLIALIALAGGPGLYGTWSAIFGQVEGGQRAGAFAANLPRIAGGALIVGLICIIAWGALLLWNKGALRPIPVVLILTGLTVLDLLRVDTRYIQIVRYDDFFPPDQGIEALRARLGPGERVLTVGGVYPEGFLASYGVPEVFGYHGNQLRWYNALTRYDVRQSARTPAELEQYWVSFLSSAALRGLAARYVLLPGQVELPGFRLLGADQRVAVYVNDGALPGASVVPEVQVEPDSARRIALLWSANFDPAKTAIVEEAVPAIGQAGGTGPAVIEGNGDDTLAVRARSSGPALLLISRTYHPSWQAEIDGVPAPVLRANHALMAVPLMAGDHRVVLRYRPRIVYLAAGITAATWAIALLVTAVAAGLSLRRRRG